MGRIKDHGQRMLKGTIRLDDCIALLLRDETRVPWPDDAVFCFALVTSGRTVRFLELL